MTYKERIKTIYIDPPYNTGNDGFVYKDNFKHSSWLSMMENRLLLARELMKEDGVIFSSIGKDEISNQEKIFDMIFIKDLFFCVKKKPNSTMGDEGISNILDFISVGYKNYFKKKGKAIKKIYEDENGKFVLRNLIIRTDMMYTGMKNNNLNLDEYIYEITFDIDEKQSIDSYNKLKKGNNIKYILPNKRRFFLKKEELRKEIVKGNIYIKGNNIFFKEYNIDYIDKYSFSKVISKDLLDDKSYFNQHGTKLVLNLFGYDIKGTPKPVKLIKYLINILDNNNSYILDFFPGSGTTADAVIRLNQEDGGNRKFILTEINNYFDTIIIPRIKKVAYSLDWKDGKLQDQNGPGIFFKYSYLEQYEDTSNKN